MRILWRTYILVVWLLLIRTPCDVLGSGPEHTTCMDESHSGRQRKTAHREKVLKIGKNVDPARIRTWNLLIRSQAPYPLGHWTARHVKAVTSSHNDESDQLS